MRKTAVNLIIIFIFRTTIPQSARASSHIPSKQASATSGKGVSLAASNKAKDSSATTVVGSTTTAPKLPRSTLASSLRQTETQKVS